jgi:hypothetical protein
VRIHESGRIRSDREITGQHEAHPTCDCWAVNRCDRGHLCCAQGFDRPRPQLSIEGTVPRRDEVEPATKDIVATPYDQDMYRQITLRVPHYVDYGLQDRIVKGITDLRPIYSEPTDGSTIFNNYGVSHLRPVVEAPRRSPRLVVVTRVKAIEVHTLHPSVIDLEHLDPGSLMTVRCSLPRVELNRTSHEHIGARDLQSTVTRMIIKKSTPASGPCLTGP